LRVLFILSALLRAGVFGAVQTVWPGPAAQARTRLALASLRFNLLGQEPAV
jgi:hypothetical protein